MDVMTAIFAVFSGIGSWIVEALNDLLAIFWIASSDGTGTGSLTFLGVLAVASLGFSVVFLIIGLIQRFLHFRG